MRQPEAVTESDGGVSVTIDNTLKVSAVTIHGFELGDEERARLEKSIMAALNGAMSRIAKTNVEHFRRVLKAP
jgi:DNA-binding protein YbaB